MIKGRVAQLAEAAREFFRRAAAARAGWRDTAAAVGARRRGLATFGVATAGAAALVAWPPLHRVEDGAVAVRVNQFSGQSEVFGAGPILALPLMHTLREYTLRERLYRPEGSRQAGGEAPFQSVEGLSIGVELAVRWALDPTQIARIARTLPADIDGEIVKPAVQAVAHEVFARHTVREIFSAKRAEIQKAIEAELKTRLAADGVLLRGLMLGPVNLPNEYRAGLDQLLAEELATEKMRYTLELREKRVRETELVAEADKARRLTQAAAAAQEQIIAARAQEEAMRHVLPFKTQQIQQRQLEAEAEKVARIRAAEGAAQARRIEAAGEADSRRKLAEAEAERLERIGRVASAQMARDGELLHRHPLLIQKTMADKLSDKIQVIIAPPSMSGGFVAASLLGGAAAAATGAADGTAAARAKLEDE
ncbi:MAG: prohibitin family protein [Burkholderiales bacterium]|nr:prohibitin family protein [Burkholderiales bacterium]